MAFQTISQLLATPTDEMTVTQSDREHFDVQVLPPMDRDEESGYASASSSDSSFPDVFFTKPHLTFLNRQLQNLEPQGGHT